MAPQPVKLRTFQDTRRDSGATRQGDDGFRVHLTPCPGAKPLFFNGSLRIDGDSANTGYQEPLLSLYRSYTYDLFGIPVKNQPLWTMRHLQV